MVNVGKGKRRKLYSILLVFAMLLGLVTDLTIPTAKAQAEEEEITGLVVTDWFDYDEDGNEVKVNDQAEYGKGVTRSLGDGVLSVKEKVGDNMTTVAFDDLELYYGDDMQKVTDDMVYMYSYTPDEETFLGLTFYKTGTYHLKKKGNAEDDALIFVNYPKAGFYSSPEKTDAGYISPYVFNTKQSDTIYLILNSDENDKVALPEIASGTESVDNYAFAVRPNPRTYEIIVDPVKVKEYFTYEKVSDAVYKVVVNKQKKLDGMVVMARVTVDNGEEKWQFDTEAAVQDYQNGILAVNDNLMRDDNYEAYDYDDESWTDEMPNVWMPWKMTIAVGCSSDTDEILDVQLVNADQLKVLDAQGNPTKDVTLESTGKDNKFVNVCAKKTGRYLLEYTTKDGDQLYRGFSVAMSSVGFFKDAVYDESGMLRGDDNFAGKYGKKDRSFYIVSDEETQIENLSVEISSENNDGWTAIADGAKVETVKEGKIYRVTLADTVTGNIQALAKFTSVYGENERDTDASIDMQLSPKDAIDTSKTTWNYTKAFTYDGKPKTVELTNLPDGVKAVYSGNTATQPGKYTAKVTLVYDEDNYEISDVVTELVWEIQQKTVPSQPGETKKPETINIKVGQLKTIGVNKYKVTSVKAGKEEVTFVGCTNKKQTKVTIPATIKLDNKTFKVTAVAANACKANKKLKQVTIGTNVKSIGKNAFSGCKKLSKVTIKSKSLTKVGKNFCKNAAKKCTVKVPKKQMKAYKKLLKKAGFKKTVKS